MLVTTALSGLATLSERALYLRALVLLAEVGLNICLYIAVFRVLTPKVIPTQLRRLPPMRGRGRQRTSDELATRSDRRPSPSRRSDGARLMCMALAKGATMGRRLQAHDVEKQGDERSLNLDAVRVSLQEAAAVLAEMTDVEASAAPVSARHE